jgi:hypothetical protein
MELHTNSQAIVMPGRGGEGSRKEKHNSHVLTYPYRQTDGLGY